MAQSEQALIARERDRLRLLLEVNNAVASHLDLRELFAAISSSLRRVVHYDAAGLTLYDAESGKLRVHALALLVPPGLRAVEEGELLPILDTPGGQAFTSRRTMIMTLDDLKSSSSPLVQDLVASGIKSGCAAPLVAHGRALGTLDVASAHEDAFTAEDAEVLSQIAGQIALAVENALNFESARRAEKEAARERDHLRLLLEVNNAVVSHLDLRDVLRAIAASLREVIHQDFMGLALYDPETKQFHAHALDSTLGLDSIREGMPIPIEGSPAEFVFTTGQTLYLPRPDTERFPSIFIRQFIERGVKTVCCAPLVAHGRTMGIMTVLILREDALTASDVELFTQIASQVAIAVENALSYRELSRIKNKLAEEKLYLEEEINTRYDFEQIIGSSPAFNRILKQVETVAPTDSTVLIQGETGTGKEIIARAIHKISARRERTLVKLNCAAIPTGLLESELFGHEKGAFTGAIAQRVGRFELAHKGTLFLDEVGEIPLELQPKLLRVLQEREFERLGSSRTSHVDVRLIAATNRSLEQMVSERQFRDDLYYRLNVFPITIPPLRERREDIPLLVRFFASKFARRMNKRIETIPAEAVVTLKEYRWPGNIRELENFIERAVILTPGKELQIPLAEMKPSAKSVTSATVQSGPTVEQTSLESVERDHILRVLRETNWVVGGADGAAARLGLKRTTLQARMKKLGIARHHAAP